MTGSFSLKQMTLLSCLFLVSAWTAKAGVWDACRRALESSEQGHGQGQQSQRSGLFAGLARVVTPLIDAKRADFSVVRALAGERIINPDVRIQYLGSSNEEKGPKAPEPPRGPNARHVVLQSRTSQEIVILNSDGEGQWFLRHLGRVYKVELTDEAIFDDGVDTWSESSSFHRLRTMNLGESFGSHYRDSTTTTSSNRAVVMPTGHVFVSIVNDPKFGLLGPSWLDPETGLIWSQALRDTMDWEHAKKTCIAHGGWLPTRSEWEPWIAHVGKTNSGELNTLFPRDARLFWSSSVLPGFSDGAYYLYGDVGAFVYDFRSLDDDLNAVRCVRSSR